MTAEKLIFIFDRNFLAMGRFLDDPAFILAKLSSAQLVMGKRLAVYGKKTGDSQVCVDIDRGRARLATGKRIDCAHINLLLARARGLIKTTGAAHRIASVFFVPTIPVPWAFKRLQINSCPRSSHIWRLANLRVPQSAPCTSRAVFLWLSAWCCRRHGPGPRRRASRAG